MASTEELQRAVYTLNNIAITHNLKISVDKAKVMAVRGKMNLRTEILIHNNITEHVNSFNYLGYTIKHNRSLKVEVQGLELMAHPSYLHRVYNYSNKQQKFINKN
jgi:hypothetical protein